MSRAKRILRFTFWTNNVELLVLMGAFWVPQSGIETPLLAALAVGLFGGIGWFLWYARQRLNIRTFRGMYWVSDEREKEIALKVHSAMLTSGIVFVEVLLLLVSVLMARQLSVYAFGRTIEFLIWLGLAAGNGQYYWLWCKYDQA
ncbi:hypothetical protein [Levilactobacillus namurensis]|uniref:Integral membrane protein n=1 Tax=Levilactobacillus namurensis TaxID=380393 RepID=A0AAW8W8K2_9LACO|nr:hypothetical protein [Levilactobacillus namurensis]MDT7015093.1 hypothetical protein [Levilactobacillus namurensis]